MTMLTCDWQSPYERMGIRGHAHPSPEPAAMPTHDVLAGVAFEVELRGLATEYNAYPQSMQRPQLRSSEYKRKGKFSSQYHVHSMLLPLVRFPVSSIVSLYRGLTICSNHSPRRRLLLERHLQCSSSGTHFVGAQVPAVPDHVHRRTPAMCHCNPTRKEQR